LPEDLPEDPDLPEEWLFELPDLPEDPDLPEEWLLEVPDLADPDLPEDPDLAEPDLDDFPEVPDLDDFPDDFLDDLALLADFTEATDDSECEGVEAEGFETDFFGPVRVWGLSTVGAEVHEWLPHESE